MSREYKKRTARRDELLRRIAAVLNEKTEVEKSSTPKNSAENSSRNSLDNDDK
jgi:hypothetical protein